MTETLPLYVATRAADPREVLSEVCLPDALWSHRVRYALAGLAVAPSVHNTQPWRLRLPDQRTVEIWPDEQRQLHRLDPRGRQLTISLGAAAFGLRVAARMVAIDVGLDLLPEGPDGPSVRAHLSPGENPHPDELGAVIAIAQRRTVRGLLHPDHPGEAVVASLVEACEREGCSLHVIDHPVERSLVAGLTVLAHYEQTQDLLLRQEVAEWSREEGVTALDGVPATAWGRTSEAALKLPLPQRDFAQGRDVPGEVESTQSWLMESPPPLLLAIASDRDDMQSWLRVGMALHRVLAVAWQQGLAGCPIDAAVEVPEAHVGLRTALGISGTPHLIIRLGRPVHMPEQPTPRRPLSDLFD